MNDQREFIFVKTLGCDKNTVDSEMMKGVLNASGYCFTTDPEHADYIIINTCCFINDAKNESIDAIFELIPNKTQGNCKKIIVMGCMAQRYGSELPELMPEIDAFVGVNDIERIVDVLKDAISKKVLNHKETQTYCEFNCDREIEPGTVTAYLKISEGCDKHCTYCAIPGIRGHHRSRQPEAIFAEAKKLFDQGIRELILIGEDITSYGTDLHGDIDLSSLLRALAENFDFTWIRLLYMYPEGINEELVEVIATHDNICKYVDMPIQHTENNILKLMGRLLDKNTICDKVYMLKNRIPDVVLRTTIITGFPGETEECFAAMLSSLKELQFDRLGAFAYSMEDGTPAAKLDHQLSDDIKEERRCILYEQQEKITAEKNEALVGKTLKVLIDETGEGIAYGRTEGDAPEIDCGVIIENNTLIPGSFYDVFITDSVGFDLLGEIGE